MQARLKEVQMKHLIPVIAQICMTKFVVSLRRQNHQ